MTKASNPLLTSPRRWGWPLLAGGVIVLIIQTVYWAAILHAYRRPENPGVFGDMFGALNTFFTGLGFMGAVYVIRAQVKESLDARAEQAESFRLLQEQVAAAQKSLDMQGARDRVEAGPFFELKSNSVSANELDLKLTNVGAPVICLDFKTVTQGCSVRGWYPSTLPNSGTLTAPTTIASGVKVFDFRMRIRDRWGTTRQFAINLDLTTGSGRLDFFEVP